MNGAGGLEKKGYKIFMQKKARLDHQLGEGDVLILNIRFRVPQPIRAYYQYRNYFSLLTRNYVPTYWKISNGVKYFIKMFVYTLFFENRKEYRLNILNGIRHGIKTLYK
jgi:rhamnosyltransferase